MEAQCYTEFTDGTKDDWQRCCSTQEGAESPNCGTTYDSTDVCFQHMTVRLSAVQSCERSVYMNPQWADCCAISCSKSSSADSLYCWCDNAFGGSLGLIFGGATVVLLICIVLNLL